MNKILDMELIAKSANEFVALDIETTGLHPDKGGRIIEIGAIKIKNGVLVDKFEAMIDPGMSVPKKITEITGITNEMVKGQPSFREVLPSLYEFIKDDVIIAHNAPFDWDRFLVPYFKKVGIYPTNRVVDTLKLCRKHFPKNEGGYKLGVLCNLLDIKLENAHRASDDALATARLFYYLKKNKIKVEGEIQLSLITEEVKVKPQNVRKVAFWEKEIKKGKFMERAYVTLDRSTVFYDFPSNAWEVKASNEPIDFKDVEMKVLRHLNLKCIDDLNEYFKKTS